MEKAFSPTRNGGILTSPSFQSFRRSMPISQNSLYTIILFFPLSFGCVQSGLLDYIGLFFFFPFPYRLILFFPFLFPLFLFFFWVCSFVAATSIGLFSLQLSLLFLYIHCNICFLSHDLYGYRHMRIPAPTDRQLFTLDFLFSYSTFTHTIIT